MKTFKQRNKEYVLTKKDERDFLDFLNGSISCRELGKRLGCSHQQAINYTGSLCCQWYQEGKLVIKL